MIIVILKTTKYYIILIFGKFYSRIMNKLFSFLILTISVFISNKLNSQTANDTILLVNGDVIIASITDTTKGVVSYRNPKAGKKDKSVDNDRIFAIKNNKGEMLYYKFDSIAGNDLTIDEMRYYIKGEQDAQKGFKPRGSFWCNVAIGAASGVTGSFFCPIPPFGFTALTGLPKVKIKHATVSNLEYLKHDTYIMGYEKTARGKRRVKSMLGGGIGLVGGLCVFWGILQPNKIDPLNP